MSGFAEYGALGFQLAGSYMQSQAIKQNAEAQAQMLRANASAYEDTATMAREKAAWDESRYRDQIRKLVGEQKSRYAHSGVRTGVGSAFEVVSETLVQGERDALAIRYGGEVEAYQNLMAADMYRQRAAHALSAGQYSSRIALMSGIGSSLISANEFGMFSSSPTKVNSTRNVSLLERGRMEGRPYRVSP